MTLDPPAAPDSNDPTGARTGREPVRRNRHLVVLGIILIKLVIIAVILVLPSGLALSLGAAHGVVLLVLLGSAAVTLVVFKLRGKAPRLALSHWPFAKNKGHK